VRFASTIINELELRKTDEHGGGGGGTGGIHAGIHILDNRGIPIKGASRNAWVST